MSRVDQRLRDLVKATNSYPKHVERQCAILGLADEWLELQMTDGDGFAGELGDVLWYSTLVKSCIGEVQYPMPASYNVSELKDDISRDMSKLIGTVKKYFRGDEMDFVTRCKDYLVNINIYLYHTITEQTRVKVVEELEKKLYSRLERNLIKGDGDKR